MKVRSTSIKKVVKWSCIILSIFMLISILPAFVLTFSTFPAPGDDYYFATPVKLAMEQDGAIALLTKPVTEAAMRYVTWQGSFVSVWLFGLNPMVFSITAYRLAMLFLNLLFVFAVYFFCTTFISRHYRQDKYIAFTLGSTFLFAFYHCLPYNNLYELCYWYTGSIFYFLTLSGLMIYAALFYRMSRRYAEDKKIGGYMVLLIAGALFLGSNNLAASISTWSGMTMLLALALYKKHPLRGKMAVIYAVLTLATLSNAISPGYMVRYNDALNLDVVESAGSSVLDILIQSFKLSTQNLRDYIGIAPTVGILLLLSPMMFSAFKHNPKKAINPLLLLVVSYLAFVAQYAPFLYALGNLQYGRIIAYRFFTAQLFYVINLVNFVAYAADKTRFKSGFKKVLAGVMIAAGLYLVVHSFTVRVIPQSHIKTILECYNDGSMATFIREENERIRILEDECIKDVVFKPMTKDSVCFGFDFTSENPDDLINTKLAEYYGKNSVVVAPE